MHGRGILMTFPLADILYHSLQDMLYSKVKTTPKTYPTP